MYKLRVLERINRIVSTFVVSTLLMQTLGVLLLQLVLLYPVAMEAARVVIDSTATTNAGSHNITGSENVFISDQVGYTFYRDSTNQCVYRKTTDGGDSWGSTVIVDSQTDCLKIVVWYDRWTPGDTTGNYIHIATMDSSLDDLFYNRLDTTTDTLLMGSSPANGSINSGQSPTLSVNVNTHSITKATDGEVYMAVNDSADSYAVSCSSSCNLTTSWNEVGTSPFDNSNDHNLMMPLSGGDVLVINRDISANDIRSTIWNGSSWSAWFTIDASAVESATYDGGLSATIDVDTGYIYLMYAADNNDMSTADHDLRTAVYTGSGWTNTTDLFTDLAGRGLHGASLGYDQNTGDIYVAYAVEDTIGDSSTGNIYWATSTDGMTTWGAEHGPLNAAGDDFGKPILTLNNYERMYVTWWGPTADDRVGDTVANIGPDTLLSSEGSMVSEVRSPTTDFYTGGKFVVESISSRNVTSVRITEKGSVDGQTELSNIKLFYEYDTSSPYNCVSESYSGSESQYGATDTNGFSGPDGSSVFSGTVASINPTKSLCLYTVVDVLVSADSGDTIDIEISDPVSDVVVSGVDIFPTDAIGITGSTTVVSPDLTQSRFHWRNDDGSESGATSATAGSENTSLTALSKESPIRLRMEVSNEGSTTSLDVAFQIEYGVAAPTCDDVTVWTDVGLTNNDWNLYDSANLTDGNNTTNIAEAIGGVTDDNSSFLTPNGGVRDTRSTTSQVMIGTTEFIEVEYSLVASSSATEGATYCFRVTDEGQAINNYNVYPSATIDADVRVSATGTAITGTDIPTTDVYFGGTFVIKENVSSRNVTGITVSEIGTVDASTGLGNVKLFYDLDTSAPYNCISESYGGGETQFGATDTDGFSAANGTSTFTGSVNITTTQAMCVYVVADVTTNAVSNDTVQFQIDSATNDVTVSSGSVAPSIPTTQNGSTTLSGGELIVKHYHWRNDDGSEAAATSATGGSEDTPLNNFDLVAPIRLRFGITNAGATNTVQTRFRLEFSPKFTTCEDNTVWTDVDAASDGWNMYNSANLTNGNDTTNIVNGIGGVTDENTTFLTPNGGVRDTESLTASTSLDTDEHIDLEYSITSTASTLNDTTYCFRVSANGTDLQGYDTYAEITTVPKRDFRVQRGNVVLTGTSTTLVAGVDYNAPSASTSAFVRITNSNNTGAGNDTGGGAQNADDVTAYIVDPENIETSFTIGRLSSFSSTFVDWELVEFVGTPGTDNEMKVRSVGTLTMTNSDLVATSTSITVTDDADVVVFVTGVRNQNTSRNYYGGQVTSDWSASSDEPVFTRGATGNSYIDISYAVVEFVGLNWVIQRAEHSYSASGVAETESITAVNSLARTFLHSQKRMGASTNVVHFGHTVWLSSIGAISFELESGADVGIEQTSVAWVIENTQTGSNGVDVQRQNGSTINGAEPLVIEHSLSPHLNALNNGSIFVNSMAAGTNNAYPRPIMGARLTSSSTYEVWRSDTGQNLSYRVEVVQWPVADLAIRQNYYRFYEDNDALTPTDPWPPGLSDLGENTSITLDDVPLGEDDYLRIRMSLRITNANMPAGFQQFKLQFAERLTTCTAVGSWTEVGNSTSSAIWRGYIGTSTVDGTSLSTETPVPGDLLISVSDVAGSLESTNPSASNPYVVFDTEDVEYDWFVQQNGANPNTPYCFRMVKSDDSPLDGYLHYPQIRTADFSPATMNWRWYSDVASETPTSPLAAENVTPANVEIDDTLALRVTVRERANIIGSDIKFKLQFSDDISFTNPVDLVASSTCVENSLWCFVDGGGTNNALISSSTLSDADSCVGGSGNGCGTHNASSDYMTGHTHGASQAKEYSFTIKHAAARVNAVYYFRLIDANTDITVPLDSGKSYPSVQSGNSQLTFSVAGLPSGTTTAGVVTDATTTATSVNFGSMPFNDDQIAAQRITVSTNATEGYQVLQYARQQMLNSYGVAIDDITSTNAAPAGWATACTGATSGCVGYHTTDATLEGGSARFGPTDTYAALSTVPSEIMYSSIPVGGTEDVIFRVIVDEMQPGGDYETDIVYLAVPVF